MNGYTISLYTLPALLQSIHSCNSYLKGESHKQQTYRFSVHWINRIRLMSFLLLPCSGVFLNWKQYKYEINKYVWSQNGYFGVISFSAEVDHESLISPQKFMLLPLRSLYVPDNNYVTSIVADVLKTRSFENQSDSLPGMFWLNHFGTVKQALLKTNPIHCLKCFD